MNEGVQLHKADCFCLVAMEEREFKNTLTPGLVKALKDAFLAIQSDPEVRVVVVHGFDSYFCCGGTSDELSEMCKGRRVGKEVSKAFEFANLGVHDLFLRCPVSVVAAMQGHGIGARACRGTPCGRHRAGQAVHW